MSIFFPVTEIFLDEFYSQLIGCYRTGGYV